MARFGRAIGSMLSAHRLAVGAVVIGAVAAVAILVATEPRSVAVAPAALVEPAQPAVADRTAPAEFPLRASRTGRYLVDHDGRPFLIVGDSPQALLVNLSVAQAGRFFAD